MIGILPVEQFATVGFFAQRRQNLWPHAPALQFQQAPMTGLVGGCNVMRQIFPRATRRQHVQDTIDDFAIIGTWATRLGVFRQKTFDEVPLFIRSIGAIRFARECIHGNLVMNFVSNSTFFIIILPIIQAFYRVLR